MFLPIAFPVLFWGGCSLGFMVALACLCVFVFRLCVSARCGRACFACVSVAMFACAIVLACGFYAGIVLVCFGVFLLYALLVACVLAFSCFRVCFFMCVC